MKMYQRGVAWGGVLAMTVLAFPDTVRGADDAELIAIRGGFEMRRDAVLGRLTGTPFKPAAKRPPLQPGRGRYTRHYAYSVSDFVLRAMLLNEQLDEANAALQDYCQFYSENPADRNDRDSFYWAADVICRVVEFFGSDGSIERGRVTNETEAAFLEMAWLYCKDTSRISDAEILTSRTWNIHESENHHLQRFSTVWHFSKFLKDAADYKSRKYDDDFTAAEHYKAWTDYAKEFLRERAKKGLFVEVASTGYGLHSIKGVYNFFDFAADEVLRRRAGYLLDLYWATWAEEQIDLVRGGGKARLYQGPSSQFHTRGPNSRLAWYYLGKGEATSPRGNEFTIITSNYRMPLVVMDIALDRTGRGCYEVKQRRMGLARDGFFEPPDYRLRTDFGGILRYSYCTPDFIIGTLMYEARPLSDWAMISSQNRWHGVVFSGHADARIFPQCRADQPSRTYNQQWSVQKKGTLIVQRLPDGEFSRGANGLRVWFAKRGLTNRRQHSGWVFVEAPDAYAAVRVVEGKYQWENAKNVDAGEWLCCNNKDSPVIIEVSRKVEHSDYEAFQRAVCATPCRVQAKVLDYQGLAGDQFTFCTDCKESPQINGKPVNYAPNQVFNSPFVTSQWNSGVVVIQKGERRVTLDFNSDTVGIQ